MTEDSSARIAAAALSGVFADFRSDASEKVRVNGAFLRELALGLTGSGKVLGILVRGARIVGPLDLSFADLNLPICLEHCDIEDAVDISGADLLSFSIANSRFRQVLGVGARIRGDVTFGGARPLPSENPEDEIAYIRLRDARIGGCVSGRGETKLVAPDAPHPLSRRRVDALELQGAEIGSAVLLDEALHADGAIWMLGARVGGNLDLAAAKIHNPAGLAVCGELATFRGTIQLVDGFEAFGQVSFTGARISHNWNMRRSRFQCDSGPALDLESAKIEGQLKAFENTVRGPITLAGAKIGRLLDDPKTAWGDSGWIDLSELSYERIGLLDGAPGSIWKDRRAWLQRSARSGAAFSRQPYEELARALAAAGHREEARKISREAQRESNKRRAPLSRAAVWLFAEQMFGYGLSPWRATITALLVWLVGWVGAEIMVSQHMLTENGARVCSTPPALYALDVAIPILDLKQEASCTVSTLAATAVSPAAQSEVDLWRWLTAIYAMVGAAVVGFGLLTASGVFRPKVHT